MSAGGIHRPEHRISSLNGPSRATPRAQQSVGQENLPHALFVLHEFGQNYPVGPPAVSTRPQETPQEGGPHREANGEAQDRGRNLEGVSRAHAVTDAQRLSIGQVPLCHCTPAPPMYVYVCVYGTGRI